MQSSKPPYRVLLSFDLEEFDIPNEYGARLSIEEQLQVTRQGMARLMPLLDELNVTATFFTTAFYAQQNPDQVKFLATKHEIASHTFYHGRFTDDHILSSRKELSAISGQPISGFRMPRLAPVDKDMIRDAGYLYDASLNPTWLPGRYNYLDQPRTIFRKNGLSIVPSSVTPRLRVPLFWLAFKNLPVFVLKRMSAAALKKDGYLSLYFHPWEYADLSGYKKLPTYISKPSGQALLEKLETYLRWLRTQAVFVTMESFVRMGEAK